MKKIFSLVLVTVLAIGSIYADWKVISRTEKYHPNGQFAGIEVLEEKAFPISGDLIKTYRREYILSNDEFVGIIQQKEFEDAIENGDLGYAGYEKLDWNDFLWSKFMDDKGINTLVLEYEEINTKDETVRFAFYLIHKTLTNDALIEIGISEVFPVYEEDEIPVEGLSISQEEFSLDDIISAYAEILQRGDDLPELEEKLKDLLSQQEFLNSLSKSF